jgi:enamine deaminase RidA (YjgF/YER057c/UK114 family)
MTDERRDLATTSVCAPSALDVVGITDANTPYPSAVRHGDLLFVSGQVSFTDEGSVAH